MNLFAIISGTVGFGILGLDPIGALIALSYLATGGRRRVVVVFFTLAAVFTLLTGLALEPVIHFGNVALHWLTTVHPAARIGVEVAAALALGVWAYIDITQPAKTATVKKKRKAGLWMMILLGVWWGVSAATDPTFYGPVALGRSSGGRLGVLLACALWFVLSQAPLVALMVGLSRGKDSRIILTINKFSYKLLDISRKFLGWALALVALAILANAMSFVVAGKFIPF